MSTVGYYAYYAILRLQCLLCRTMPTIMPYYAISCLLQNTKPTMPTIPYYAYFDSNAIQRLLRLQCYIVHTLPYFTYYAYDVILCLGMPTLPTMPC